MYLLTEIMSMVEMYIIKHSHLPDIPNQANSNNS